MKNNKNKNKNNNRDWVNQITENVKNFRRSNLVRHNYVIFPLLNYFKPNKEDPHSLIDKKLPTNPELKLDENLQKYSPRYVFFNEICLFHHYKELLSSQNEMIYSATNKTESIYEKSFNDFYEINYEYRYRDNDNKRKEQLKKAYFQFECDNKSEIKIQNLTVNNSGSLKEGKLRVAIANTIVNKKNIYNNIIDKSYISTQQKNNFIEILNATDRIKPNVDLVVLPEVSVPYMWLPVLMNETKKKQKGIIAGLEHININNTCYNLTACILPINVNGVKDAILSLRLKNHYSPSEEHMIKGYDKIVPKLKHPMYYLYQWRGVFFGVYNCYELANIRHRTIFRSKVDVLIAIEYNRDVNYFSNIAESISRDIHCYFMQVNSSDFGDSRVTQPSKSITQDLIRLKGGDNVTVLSTTLDIQELRKFQIKRYTLQKGDDSFKPTPPDFDHDEVRKRY